MLEFRPLTLADLPSVRRDLSRDLPRTCDFSVGGLLLWRDYLQVQWAESDGSVLYFLRLPDGTEGFQVPADPDPNLLIQLREYCKESGIPCRFLFVPAERKDEFFDLFGNVTVTDQRDWYDYLYRKDDLITYGGKKLRGQRNHVNKFRTAYPNWTFKKAAVADVDRLREFYDHFRKNNQKDAPSWKEEEKKIREVFDHFEDYDFLCGILSVDGHIVGFSLGETVGDTLMVHTEKADRNIAGAYPMLASRFVEAFADDSVRYVNREDDSGDEGLRTAKLSYHPCALLEKCMIEIP
ncbi:MAG: DUF2156 domain-containing protein [Clostridia bacterium]|nr:DUF2156 domain-containing protein [Clostridia bacterium]